MKKIIPILFILFLIYGFINKEEILIPDYAIRFRVIANSNTLEDQNEKMEIKSAVEKELNALVSQAKSSKEAESIIENNLENIKEIINQYTTDYQINFGLNYFPEKEYKGVTYPSGDYESLVITLGSGAGDNWWCVMFPPLCLLEAKEEGTEEIHYTFYVKEILDKYTG